MQERLWVVTRYGPGHRRTERANLPQQPWNNELQQTSHGLNGGSLLNSVFDGRNAAMRRP